MKHDDLPLDASDAAALPATDAPAKSDGRRQFLQNAGAAVGAAAIGSLILTRAVPAQAQQQDGTAAAPTTVATILDLNEHPKLATAGGFEIVNVGADRVIVAHTASGFTACSAICTHKGCEVEYNLDAKQFICPCHGARFDEDGKVVKGPARVDLKPFDAANALVVKPR